MSDTPTPVDFGDRIVLGCNAIGLADRAEDARLIAGALDHGICTFDTADIYTGGESERRLGCAIGQRSDVVVISKFGHPATVRDHAPGSAPAIRRSLEASLRRLGRDRIEIYLIHFPDPATPIEQTLDTLARLREEGRIGGWGASNTTIAQVQTLLVGARARGLPPPALIQGELHLLSEPGAMALARAVTATKVPFGAFFPLAAGLLGGRREAGGIAPSVKRQRVVKNVAGRFYTPRNLVIIERLAAFCAQHGVALPHLALAWLLAQEDCARVVMGASSADQLSANLCALRLPLDSALLSAARQIVLEAGEYAA